jgi:hypothetical protein
MAQITSNRIDSHTYECIVTSWETLKNGMPYGKETIIMVGSEPPEWGEWVETGKGTKLCYKQRKQSIRFIQDIRHTSPVIVSVTDDGNKPFKMVCEAVFDHESGRFELR